MPKDNICILSTRPLGANIAQHAAAHAITIEEIAFIETNLSVLPETIDTIKNYLAQTITAIFTSMNAVNAVAAYVNRPPLWKIYCIGNTTKKEVEEHFGINAVAGTAESAEVLGDSILRDKIEHAVFFCGDQRRDELPEKLKQHSVTIDEVVVYKTIQTPVTTTKSYNGILFFSPSAVESFFSVNQVEEATQLFAIGSTTAKAIQQFNKSNVVISGFPDKENMVKQVIEYYSE